ncbi:MAG: hypothetical protein V4858_17300 [Pseudomonadota bacterium]
MDTSQNDDLLWPASPHMEARRLWNIEENKRVRALLDSTPLAVIRRDLQAVRLLPQLAAQGSSAPGEFLP